MSQALLPQFNSVAGIEGMAPYFTASDPGYARGILATPRTFFNLFGVRFVVDMPGAFSTRTARERNFHQVGFGYWVGEYALHPRAFVVGRATRVTGIDDGIAQLTSPGFDVRQQAVMRGPAAPPMIEGNASAAEWERTAPGRMRVRAQGPGLLVVGEHFDAGWSATVDGRPAQVLETDLAALGVVLPPSAVTVELKFVPAGFLPGLAVALAAAGALLAARWGRRKWVPVG
jgi:hypothetical protein